MAFIDCLLSKVDRKLLTKGQVDTIVGKYETLVERYKRSMGDEQAAAQAASDLVTREAQILADKKRNSIRGALAQRRIMDDLEKQVGEGVAFDEAVRNLYERAYSRKYSILKQYYANIDEFVEKFRSKAAGLYRNTRDMEPVVREMLGETTGNAEARAFGESLRKTFDLAHKRYKAAGGIIGKIDNYFPQIHAQQLIKAVSFEEWHDFIRPRLDIDRMIDMDTGLPFTEEKLLKLMRDDYEGIVTNGLSELKKRAEKGLQTFGFGKDVSQRRMASRFYHFKDAQSFLEYNSRFGSGDDGLFDMVIGSLEGTARDTGVLEILGPTPNAIQRHLDLQLSARGTGVISKSWTNGMYDILAGRTDGLAGESWWFTALANTQNVLRSALLGSASISAISDSTFIVATARLNGLSGTQAIKRYLKLLNPTSSADRTLAKRSGYIADIARGRALTETRFAGEAMGGKVTSWLAGFTNRASGLQAMTKAASDAMALEAEGALADLVTRQVTFGNLDKSLREALSAHGIGDSEWNVILKSKLFEPEKGVKFLRSQEITLTDVGDAKLALETATKVDDWINTMRFHAVNDPTLRTQALSTGAMLGDGRKGSGARALASSLFMFKSFPVTVLFNHVLPSLRRAANHQYEHFATVFVGTTLLGGMALQLKDLSKGKDPRSTDSWRFWAASALQGGGMGLFGDFLFADYSRFGRDPIVDSIGPVAGLGSDVLRTFMGNFQRALEDESGKSMDKFKRDVFNLAKRNTPAVSLWYTRLVLERLLLDEIERMADPRFDRHNRMIEKRMQREFGQQFWWRRGQQAPQRAPRLDNVVGR